MSEHVRRPLISLDLNDLSLFLQSEHPVGTELEVPFQTAEEKGLNCGHHCINLRKGNPSKFYGHFNPQFSRAKMKAAGYLVVGLKYNGHGRL